MKYNFDEVIDRKNTDSMKWSASYLERHFGSADCVPLWVADMDFRTAQPVIDAVTERAGHGIYGYALPGDEFYEAVIKWQKRRNGWEVKKEWIVFSPGVVPALWHIVRTFCSPGEKVILQSPVYYPFYKVIEDNGCQVINNRLINNGGRYEMNFDELEKQAADGSVRMMILCSPHNPVGRVWTKEELRRVSEICFANDVLLVSDEIHSDLVFRPNVHTPAASLSEELMMNTITCMAPSKTFNLAGVQVSDVIVPDRRLRRRLAGSLKSAGVMPNVFGLAAQTAAYNEGEEWLEQLLEYLAGNLDFMENFITSELPEVKFRRPEGTYLAWLDFSGYGFTTEELQNRMKNKAGVALDDGYIFGDGGEPCQRINFACPRSVLIKAMERLRKGVE
ncbi:MAG: MalY/PatB family protein [Lentihominibacter sp.]|nr:MalY/PatB family protein [Lentihominibacter sp.]